VPYVFILQKIPAKIMVGKRKEALSNFLTKQWCHAVMHPAFFAAGIHVDMLRLDLIHPLVSGNKWLKLQYWLEKYDTGKFKGIITSGGPWSNHLHACGFACKTNSIPMKAIVKARQDMKTATLNDLATWGCEIVFANRTKFYDEASWKLMAYEIGWLFIPLGGDGSEGVQGVTEWFSHLPLSAYDATLISIGTGTTLSGLAESSFDTGDIFAFDPGTGDGRLKEKLQKMAETTGKKITYCPSESRFGHWDATLKDFMESWHHHTRISLDFVYTAPLCQSLLKQVNEGQFAPGKHVLLVHTGGLQGNRSKEIQVE
jgi:1-aminocyclopropane-1-carboxylate deaminase